MPKINGSDKQLVCSTAQALLMKLIVSTKSSKLFTNFHHQNNVGTARGMSIRTELKTFV